MIHVKQFGLLMVVAMLLGLTGCAGGDEPSNTGDTSNGTATSNGTSASNGETSGCSADNDCSGEEVCERGTCVEGLCERDSDCENDQICLENSGICVTPECIINADCGPGEFCEPDDKKCRPGCSTDGDCPSDQICNPNTLSCESNNQCANDDACDEQEICREGKCSAVDCTTDSHCPEGQACDQGSNTCRPLEGFCQTDGDCAASQKCDQENNVCIDTGCGNCPEGTTCNEEAGECWQCSGDNDCGENGECNLTTHTCVESRCTMDGDCPGDQLCNRISGQCEERTACQADSFEPNDSRESARRIGVGRFTGLSVCAGDEDWYEINLSAGDTLEIKLTFSNAEGNLDLALFDPNERQIGAGSSNSNNELITAGDLALSGTYKVRIFGVDNSEASYDVSVEVESPENPVCADDGFEDNDSADQAAPIIAQDFPNLTICPGDPDWFKIRLEPGERLTATATFTHEAGDLDLVLLAPDGETILGESRTSDDNEMTQTSPSSVSGDFLIRIQGASPAVRNAYQLAIAKSDAPDSSCEDDGSEPNDSGAEPRVVEPGLLENLKICAGNEDWYGIALNAGDDIEVLLGFEHSPNTDLELALYHPDNLTEALAQSRSRSNDELIGFSDVPSSGIYLLRVFGANDNVSNTYEMLVERTRAPSTCADDDMEDNDNRGQAVEITSGTLNGQLCSGDEDWFAVQLDGGGSLVANLIHDSATGNLDLEVFDPDGGSLGVSASPDANTEDVSIFEVPASGLYFLRVFGALGAENNYRLDLLTEGSSCTDDGQEENDSMDNAQLIDFGTLSNLTICPDDEDWYAVDLNVGETLTAAIEFIDADGDLDLWILNEGGEIIASSTDILDIEEATTPPVVAAGLIFVRVFGFRGAANPYTMTLTRTEAENACADDGFEPNDSQIRPASIFPGSFPDLQICPEDDDWYSLFLFEDEVIDISITFNSVEGDLDIELFNPDGAFVEESRSIANVEQFTHRAQTEGIYLVHVYGFQGASNTYDMEMNILDEGTCIEDNMEPNNSQNDASLIDVNRTFTGLGLCQEQGSVEEDWYAFEAIAGETIEAFILFNHADADIDMELYQLGGEDFLIDSAGSRDSEEILFDVTTTDFYLLRVFPFDSGTISTSYDMSVDITISL